MRASQPVAAFFGFLFLAAALAGLYYLVRFGLGLFAGVDVDVTAVAAVAALALLISASIVANGLHAVARAADQRQQREVRAAVYAGLLRADATDAAAAGERLVLHASPGVLNAYLRLRRAEAAGAAAPQEAARLVRAMRRDLGHRAPDVGAAELAELLHAAEPGRV